MKRSFCFLLCCLFVLTLTSCVAKTSPTPEENTPPAPNEPACADYSAVYAALSRVPTDLSPYTKKSAEALKKAVEAVQEGLTEDNQDTVDGFAAALEEALNALKERQTFDSLQAIIDYVDSCGIDFDDIASFSMNGHFEDVILQKTEDAGEAYLNETYFIGDSITLYMHRYSSVPSENIYGVGSINPQNAAMDALVTLESGAAGTFAQAMGEEKPRRVVITIGTNSMLMDSIDYLTYFAKLIEDIKVYSPETQIIVQSTSPLTASYEKGMRLLTNRNLNRSNMLLAGLCVYEDVYFLNSAEDLKNENGQLDDQYDLGEGYGHINADAYAVWETYLRTHAIP